MKDKVVRLRVDDNFIKLLDQLVKDEHCKNRSDCIRKIITEYYYGGKD